MPRRPRDPGVPSSPSEYFGTELRARRELSKLSRPQLAERLGYSPQWIGQIESGIGTPSEDFANDCDAFFQASGTFRRIWEWMQELGKLQVLPPGFPDFVEREREAEVVYVFETMLITGLFQTPEYAREVLKSGKTPDAVEQLVTARMERQEILKREAPPHVVTIFDEGAVRRPIGNPEVLKGQIEHLANLAELYHVTVQIVPTVTGAYAGLPGAFTILSFQDEPDAVLVEGHVGGQLVDHPAVVRKYGVRFDLIRASALNAGDSLDFLRTILESL
ncbi:helix-turn-helix domain-containing protein [Actinomadura decatromicini]|uniref:Helix-turn-helix domain-containing protein n=1 Tax=Actinomadura decatromicini TaxID=2604572 RepID=A0A5D3F988_9ACTN|nr:helix-turn-helix transcriptional regulator [Actinomadura decatromicini]TYK44669.1 helix-turn-helix domain-containing protein [Actinomadura decatromicini]